MRIAKFGGGCLRNPEDYINVAKILKEDLKESIVLVVSAAFGVTDLLHNSTKFALKSEGSIPLSIANFQAKHLEILEHSISDSLIRDRVRKTIEEKIKKLERLLYGVAYIGEVTESVWALILSQGERLSAAILTGVLIDQGLQAEPLESDSIGLLTDCLTFRLQR
jgi:aspartate kinase